TRGRAVARSIPPARRGRSPGVLTADALRFCTRSPASSGSSASAGESGTRIDAKDLREMGGALASPSRHIYNPLTMVVAFRRLGAFDRLWQHLIKVDGTFA